MDESLLEAIEAITGGALNPRELLSKMDDASEVHLDGAERKRQRQQRQAQIGLASNIVGGAAGIAALNTAARDPRLTAEGAPKALRRIGRAASRLPGGGSTARHARPKSPRQAAYLAGGALALQAANTGGDAVANRVLARESKKVSKGLASSIASRMPGLKGGTMQAAAASGPYKAGGNAGRVRRVARSSWPNGRDQRLMGRKRNQVQRAARVTATPEEQAAIARRGRKMLLGGTAATSATAGAAGGYSFAQADPGKVVATREQLQAGLPERFQPPKSEVIKADAPKKRAFGWLQVSKMHHDAPLLEDRQGDLMEIDELEETAYKYVRESRVGGEMHARDADLGNVPVQASEMIESMVVTPEKLVAMGVPEQVAKDVPVGWWGGYQITKEDTWAKVESKELTGFSVHGSAKREPVIAKSLTPKRTRRQRGQEQLMHTLKNRQAVLSGVGATMGLAALSSKGGGTVARRLAANPGARHAGGQALQARRLARAEGLDRAATNLTIGGAGVGGLSGINFTRVQRKEATGAV